LNNWHIITGEYPPQTGGVSDYTSLVANGLAFGGNTVHVWAPECDLPDASSARIELHRLPGQFGPRALALLTRAFKADRQSPVLVQYVPHAYGFKAMNLPFCLWLNSIPRSRITVMFHEVAFPVAAAQPLKHNLLGLITRLMARLVCRSAARIIVASERWQVMLGRLGATAPISWAPIPSTIAVVRDTAATARWRQWCVASNGLLVGHFANYCDYSVKRLSEVLPALLEEHSHMSFLLLGAQSDQLRKSLVTRNTNLGERVRASGVLAPGDLSSALAACDMMLQPYPDGVSTRRSSTSTLLAHGRPIATTSGVATERLWNESGAVATAPVHNRDQLREIVSRIASNDALRSRLKRAAQVLYRDRFALRHTIAALIAD
jgi:glycosyltransferase involved in cell wall biosynthesis